MPASATRAITLCADDYGLSEGVNRAIRDLITRRRINATSIMVLGPAATPAEIAALKDVADGPHCRLGLHTTLTAPFRPLTTAFAPLDNGRFLPLGRLLAKGVLRQLDPKAFHAEISAQLTAFAALVGRAPDYVDGHQHVQLFPRIRDAFIAAVKTHAPNAWVRQCGRAAPAPLISGNLAGSAKTLLLDHLSRAFQARCAKAEVATNPAFAGAYDFLTQTDFAAAMAGFLDGLPDRALVMCHPGFVDETLIALDPLTDQREREYHFLAGDGFANLLAAKGVALA